MSGILNFEINGEEVITRAINALHKGVEEWNCSINQL